MMSWVRGVKGMTWVREGEGDDIGQGGEGGGGRRRRRFRFPSILKEFVRGPQR